MMIYPLTKVLPKHNQDKNQQIVTPQLEILPQAMSVKQFFFFNGTYQNHNFPFLGSDVNIASKHF